MKQMIAVLVVLLVMTGCSGSGSSGSNGLSGNDADSSGNTNGSIPLGAFWCSVTVSAPDCVPVEGAPGVEVCAQKTVKQVEIVEESTTEILGMCSFGESNVAMTGTVPSGYRFWCERIQADGGTEIKIHSMQANLPLIHVYWFSTDADSPGGIHWEEYARPAGLHGPDGTVYSDPYEEVAFTFAGYKKLVFHARDKDYAFMQDKALQPLRDLYDASMTFTEGAVAEVAVYDTLDGRAKMTENPLRSKGWKVKAGETRGNLGTYEYAPSLSIGATPIIVTDILTGNEKQVSGNILVERDSENVADAVVRVNGVTVPHAGEGLYDVAAADLSGGPGTTFTIEVTTTDPEENRSITFTCPQAIEFSNPAAGSLVTSGEKTVQWSPGIPYDHAMRFAGGAILGNYACYTQASGNEVSAIGHGAAFITLSAGQASQSLALDECRRYLLELQYPGERVIDYDEDDPYAFQMGYCSVRHRIWLYGPD